MGRLPDDLVQPDRTLIETHISWVLLGTTEVWKVKKPVDFGFVDFHTLEQRRAACEAEVRLNRRLAPDVYLDVVPVTEDESGRFHFGGSGPTIDWAVHMRRLSDSARADLRLDEGGLGFDDIERIAACLVRFHASATSLPEDDPLCSPDLVAYNVAENFDQTREELGTLIDESWAKELEDWQRHFVDSRRDLFRARARAGKVRDGHGDLRLEHIYLEDSGAITIIDCVEFNDRLRIADVCCDLAFLVMDLAYHGRLDLAEYLLAIYARDANDYELYRLVDFYASYRAHVRAKVALLLGADESTPFITREAARASARRYLSLAVAEERRPLTSPSVIAIGGVIASGKSTIAGELGRRVGAPVITSDRTRKFLSGARVDERLDTGHFRGAYAPEQTERVYEELVTRADAVLASGRAVILDASFRAAAQRASARRIAERHGVAFHFVECRAPIERLRSRLLERETRKGEVSDARADLLETFLAEWEPADELPPRARHVLDTSLPLESSLERLLDALPLAPIQ